MLTWIIEKIDYYWGLFLKLDPATAIALFLVFGIAFEVIYSRSLYLYRDFKSVQAANANTLLYLISLWGMSEAISNNITYCIPIAIGSWIGVYVQVKIEKRRSERERQTSGEEAL